MSAAANSAGSDSESPGDEVDSPDGTDDADGSTTRSDSASDQSPEPTDGDGSDTQPSDAEPPGELTIEYIKTPLVDDGPIGIYGSIEVDVGEVYSSNASLEDLFSDAPSGSDYRWMVAAIDLEAQANLRGWVGPHSFRLSGPDGRSTTAEAMADTNGDELQRADFDGRESNSVFVLFETDQLVTDGDGWEIIHQEGAEIPLVLPLNGTVADSLYPIPLEAGAVGQAASAHIYSAQGCTSILSTEVLDASVLLETVALQRFKRAEVGMRYVEVTLLVGNDTERTGDVVCDQSSGSLDRNSFRLSADGRPKSSIDSQAKLISIGATFESRFLFEIPSDTKQLQLIGQDDTVVAEWTPDLATVPGE